MLSPLFAFSFAAHVTNSEQNSLFNIVVFNSRFFAFSFGHELGSFLVFVLNIYLKH